MKSCPICESEMHSAFSAQILKKYDVDYYHCHTCGLLQTDEPYWLEEAYSDAIAIADTGLVMRNISLTSKLVTLLYFKFDTNSAYLDVAGGLGMLTRLMRDYGFDYYWDDKYCQNQLARGFEAANACKPFAALTAFEVLEHVHNPLDFIMGNLKQYGCKTFIFTTELYQGGNPPPKDWWYYAFNTGQHISFYNQKTLETLARRLNLNFYSLHGVHILTDKNLNVGLWLKICLGRFSRIFALLIRKKLGSLTLVDHFQLMSGLTENPSK